MVIVQFFVTSVPESFFGNQPMKATWLCLTLCSPMNYTYSPWNSPGQNTGEGSCFLHQGIFPTQGLNPDLLCWGWILYQLSHQGSPLRILEWLTYPFSQRIFLTQESNQGLLHCRQMRYQLSYQEAQFWPSTGWQKLWSPMSLCAFPIIIPVRLCFFLWI